MEPKIARLIPDAMALNKRALGRLVSVFEDIRPEAAELRERVLSEIEKRGPSRRGRFLGFTGSPGAGKSTLIGRIGVGMVSGDPDVRVAMVAVDPSSRVSGGAFLGDRTRVRFPTREKRLFFRSQAADLELGGVSRSTFQVSRLLHRLFDYVFIETVGIGQSEIEVQYVADRIYLVLQPMAGDEIQFMKAGIMEIPDIFVLNKCDESEEAERSYYALRTSLSYARPNEGEEPRIVKASALTGLGIDELITDIVSLSDSGTRHTMEEKEGYFFEKWVRDEYGRAGLKGFHYRHSTGLDYIREAGSFERAQRAFADGFREPE